MISNGSKNQNGNIMSKWMFIDLMVELTKMSTDFLGKLFERKILKIISKTKFSYEKNDTFSQLLRIKINLWDKKKWI